MASKKDLTLYVRNITNLDAAQVEDPTSATFTRVEFFKDESVQLTQTVKNIKDPVKIFTAFSQKFTVPASSSNNKLFGYFYDHNIGGFDSRIKIPARLELNTLPFKEGYIKLEGSSLKDDKVQDYKITFFGSTVTLAQVFGQDTLRNLTWLNAWSFVYNEPNIKSRLTTFSANNVSAVTWKGETITEKLTVPLISNTKRYYYKSNEPQSQYVEGSGNLYPQSGRIQGVYWEDLKPTIPVTLFFRAIEEAYPSIAFDWSSDGFLNDIYGENLRGLRMLLSKTQGKVTNNTDNEPEVFPTIITTFPPAPQVTTGGNFNNPVMATSFPLSGNIVINIDSQIVNLTNNSNQNVIRLFLTPTTADLGTLYSAQILYNGTVVEEVSLVNGVRVLTPSSIQQVTSGTLSIIIAPTSSITFQQIRLEITRDPGAFVFVTNEFIINTIQFVATPLFEITTETPTMKVLDFLKGIFNMFNVIAEVKLDIITNREIIYLKTYNQFYFPDSGYKQTDITKFVDTSKTEVNATLPYNLVRYAYKDLKTIFCDFHNQIVGQEWGTETYRGATDGVFVGPPYKIEVPFGHQKYERLFDVTTEIQKNIQWGWSVDKEQQPILDKPLLLYTYFQDEADVVSYMPTNNSVSSFEDYYVPSNDLSLGSSNLQSLNFFPERSEWSGLVSQITLFTKYHQRFIEGVFSQDKRIIKLSAYLPDNILFDLSLSDRFIVKDTLYIINSIKTNFATGLSELELLTEDKL